MDLLLIYNFNRISGIMSAFFVQIKISFGKEMESVQPKFATCLKKMEAAATGTVI